jgi:hypothetical protein
MLLGHRTVLTAADQDAVALWVSLKMMVADLGTPSEAVFAQADRAAFRQCPAVPTGMKIWLFGYGGINWRSTLRQDSHLMSTSPTPNPSPEERPPGLPKNTRTMTLGFGCLLVHAFFTRVADFDRVATIDFKGSVVHLCPRRREIVPWPPGPFLNERDADFVCRSMERVTASPRAIAVASEPDPAPSHSGLTK